LAAIDETAPETPVLYVEGTSIPTDIRENFLWSESPP